MYKNHQVSTGKLSDDVLFLIKQKSVLENKHKGQVVREFLQKYFNMKSKNINIIITKGKEHLDKLKKIDEDLNETIFTEEEIKMLMKKRAAVVLEIDRLLCLL